MKTGSYFEVPCLFILSPSAAAVWRAAAQGDAGELKGIKNKIKFLFEATVVLKKKTKKERKIWSRLGVVPEQQRFFSVVVFFFSDGEILSNMCYATCKVQLKGSRSKKRALCDVTKGTQSILKRYPRLVAINR